MSLINDALKKAQKQRTDGTPPLSAMPSIGGEPASRIAKRNKPLAFNSLLLWIGGGCLAITIFLLGGFLLVRKPNTETPPPAKPTAVSTISPTPAATAPIAPAPTVTNTAAPYVLPNAPAAASTRSETVVAKVVENIPVVAAPITPPPEPESPKVIPRLSAPKVAYIDAQRVAGIRVSTTDSKVLMNDHVYRLGDIVEHAMGLKLVGISATSLTFEDESGARYTRNF